jgi:tetratricopeptide (TPR) repeat protein
VRRGTATAELAQAETDLGAVTGRLRAQASRAQVAWAQLARAELYAQRGELDRTKEALEDARRGGPEKNAAFWEAAARAALEAYDVAGAQKDAQRAIGLNPELLGPHQALAAALLEDGDAEGALKELAVSATREMSPSVLLLRARARLDLGRMEPARRDLDEAAAKASDLPEVALVRARIDLGERNYARAIEEIRRLADRMPSRADVWELYGSALERHDDDKAKSAFEKAAKLNPRAFTARVELARLLRREGKISDAATRLQEALRVRQTPAAERDLGELLIETGDLVAAQQAFRVALGASKTPDVKLLLGAARAAALAGDPVAAEPLITQAEARKPPRGACARLRAEAALAAGRPRDALPSAKQAFGATPGDAEVRALYAIALAKAGQVAKGRLLVREGLRRGGGAGKPELVLAQLRIEADEGRPDVAAIERAVRQTVETGRPPRLQSEAYTLLGTAYYAAGKAGYAGAAFDDALARNGKNARAHLYKGLLLVDRKHAEEAKRELAAAAEGAPPVPQAWFELAKLLRDSADDAAAQRSYERYLRLAPTGDHADEARRELAQLRARNPVQAATP